MENETIVRQDQDQNSQTLPLGGSEVFPPEPKVETTPDQSTIPDTEVNIPIGETSFDGVIPVEAVDSPVSVQVPQGTAQSSIEAEIEGLIAGESKIEEQRRADAQAKEERLALFGDTEGVAQETIDLFQSLQDTEENAKIRSEIEKLNVVIAKKKQRELALQTGEIEGTAGITQAVANRREARDLMRLQAGIATDIAILQNKQGRLDEARETAKLGMEAQQEAERRAFDIEKTFLQRAYDTLSDAEKRSADIRINKIDRKQQEFDQMSDVYANVVLNGGSKEILDGIRQAGSIDEARQIAGILGMSPEERARLANLNLQNQKLRMDIANAKTVSQSMSGKRVLSQEDADKFKKQLVESDAYEALDGLDSVIEAIVNYETVWDETGNFDILPTERKERLRTAYTNVQLEAKNLFELGVIAGADLDLINNILGGDPSDTNFGLKLATNPNAIAGVNAGIDRMKSAILNGVVTNTKTINDVYGDLDPEQIPSLKTVQDNAYKAMSQFATSDEDVLNLFNDTDTSNQSNQDFFNSIGK
jgi:hypothetical protein